MIWCYVVMVYLSAVEDMDCVSVGYASRDVQDGLKLGWVSVE